MGEKVKSDLLEMLRSIEQAYLAYSEEPATPHRAVEHLGIRARNQVQGNYSRMRVYQS